MRGQQVISSKAANGREVARGLSQRLRTLSGANAVRMIERAEASIDEHKHDWPILSLYVMGSCTRFFAQEATTIAGPCAVLHPAGAFHSSHVGAAGLEQIDIEFDPAWLRLAGSGGLDRVQHWRGGMLGDAARRLAASWSAGLAPEANLSRATATFLQLALTSAPPREPHWLPRLMECVEADPAPRTLDLARQLGLHPAWLTQAYRNAAGEGLQQTLLRKRVERAAVLLRNTADPAAEIAAEAGFYDQSHMIRCFRQLLGRTPNAVRAEA